MRNLPKFMEFNFVENWMNYKGKIMASCGRILISISIVEFCEIILK